ncbi:MvaI/BcnI family restriction endonuclease [Virgibacillus halodenitrificans]|uniref:MvaI/BcnI family restriction endonuclease n=1 Tax=Virgibacillus halodenitrificans TaxID=1482 RepID=UPI001F3AC7B2|nr:MvaI/BcnI family restriction endonuclease [Virgibacillus halodenitrificans]
MNIEELVIKLRILRDKGFLPTKRTGVNGVSCTLKQELNNLGKFELELKTSKKNTNEMLTLFIKEPLSVPVRGKDKYLLQHFGTHSKKDNIERELYTTIGSTKFNSQGFKLVTKNEKIKLIHLEKEIEIFWDRKLLQQIFEAKIGQVVLILADFKGEGYDEEFHYNTAYLLKGFNYDGFVEAIRHEFIKVDLRMVMNKNFKVKNHGTSFRVIKSKLPLCFKEVIKII